MECVFGAGDGWFELLLYVVCVHFSLLFGLLYPVSFIFVFLPLPLHRSRSQSVSVVLALLPAFISVDLLGCRQLKVACACANKFQTWIC